MEKNSTINDMFKAKKIIIVWVVGVSFEQHCGSESLSVFTQKYVNIY